jgi:hypothetical protein
MHKIRERAGRHNFNAHIVENQVNDPTKSKIILDDQVLE